LDINFDVIDPSPMVDSNRKSLVKDGYVGRWVRADNERRIKRILELGGEDVIGEDGNPLAGLLGRAIQVPEEKWDEFSRSTSPTLDVSLPDGIEEGGEEEASCDVAPDIQRSIEFLRDKLSLDLTPVQVVALDARDYEGWHSIDAYVKHIRSSVIQVDGKIKEHETREEAIQRNRADAIEAFEKFKLLGSSIGGFSPDMLKDDECETEGA
jgi:hypothetical protein